MTKGELIAALEPFPDDEEIGVLDEAGEGVGLLGVHVVDDPDPGYCRVLLMADL